MNHIQRDGNMFAVVEKEVNINSVWALLKKGS